LQEWEDLPLLQHHADRVMLVNWFFDSFPLLWQQHEHASRAASLSKFVVDELRWCAKQANTLFLQSYADTITFPSSPAHGGRRSSVRLTAAARAAGPAP
jgi:hypothetical protein